MITLKEDIKKEQPKKIDPFKEEVKESKYNPRNPFGITEEERKKMKKKEKPSKYKAKKVEYKGIVFDSTSERDYYIYLEEQKELGNVKAFRVQPKFTLLPPFQTEDLVTYKGTSYISDFEVMYADGSIEVIDIKGFATPMSKVKKKLFHFFYPKIKLTWKVKNKKWGEDNGFIEYSKLEQIRSKNRREKKKNEK